MGAEWQELADMPFSVTGAYCGSVTDDDGVQRVIVTGGQSGDYNFLTFVYDVANDEWSSDGPPHPNDASFFGVYVPYQVGDNNSALSWLHMNEGNFIIKSTLQHLHSTMQSL